MLLDQYNLLFLYQMDTLQVPVLKTLLAVLQQLKEQIPDVVVEQPYAMEMVVIPVYLLLDVMARCSSMECNRYENSKIKK